MDGVSVSGFVQALAQVPGVIGAVVATDEGLPVAAQAGGHLDTESLAAAAAVLGQLGRRAAAESELGGLDLLVVDASKLRLLVHPIALGHLMALAEGDADTEQVIAALRRAAADLDRVAQDTDDPCAADADDWEQAW